MGYGKSLQLGPGTNSPSLLLPPWQGSLAAPEMRTGSWEVSSAKAKNINSLLMGSVGSARNHSQPMGFYPKVPGVKGKLSSGNSALGWLPVCANGGGKGSELGFSEGCILHVSLQLFTQLLAKSTTCFKDLYLCGAGLGSHSFEGEKGLVFPISPLLVAQGYALKTNPLLSLGPWAKMSPHSFPASHFPPSCCNWGWFMCSGFVRWLTDPIRAQVNICSVALQGQNWLTS